VQRGDKHQLVPLVKAAIAQSRATTALARVAENRIDSGLRSTSSFGPSMMLRSCTTL